MIGGKTQGKGWDATAAKHGAKLAEWIQQAQKDLKQHREKRNSAGYSVFSGEYIVRYFKSTK